MAFLKSGQSRFDKPKSFLVPPARDYIASYLVYLSHHLCLEPAQVFLLLELVIKIVVVLSKQDHSPIYLCNSIFYIIP